MNMNNVRVCSCINLLLLKLLLSGCNASSSFKLLSIYGPTLERDLGALKN
jgi:hypothetical protein